MLLQVHVTGFQWWAILKLDNQNNLQENILLILNSLPSFKINFPVFLFLTLIQFSDYWLATPKLLKKKIYYLPSLTSVKKIHSTRESQLYYFLTVFECYFQSEFETLGSICPKSDGLVSSFKYKKI